MISANFFSKRLQTRSYQNAASLTFVVVCLLCKICANYTICRSFLQMGFVVILDLTPIQYLDVETQLEEISCLMLWPWNFKTLKLWNFLLFICKQPPELSATKRNWLDENSSRSSNVLQCWGKDLKSDSLRQFAKEDLRIWASGSPSDLRARLVTARYVDNVHSAQSTINMAVHKKGKAGPNACYAHKVSILRSAISQTLTPVWSLARIADRRWSAAQTVYCLHTPAHVCQRDRRAFIVALFSAY